MNKTNINHNLTLVSGPTRSGKSEWSEKLLESNHPVVYIATNIKCEDPEWKKRIQQHIDRRPKSWGLIENPADLSKAILSVGSESSLLIDSLGGFVSTHIASNNAKWKKLKDQFILSLRQYPNKIVIVIEETGWGIVATTKIGNLFIDRLGSLSRELEEISTESWLIIHGRAIDIHKFSVPL